MTTASDIRAIQEEQLKNHAKTAAEISKVQEDKLNSLAKELFEEAMKEILEKATKDPYLRRVQLKCDQSIVKQVREKFREVKYWTNELFDKCNCTEYVQQGCCTCGAMGYDEGFPCDYNCDSNRTGSPHSKTCLSRNIIGLTISW